ncbi:MAG: hypothetical protein D6679_02740 [Candidatus Hydrogenedentota bacterium]|nr:MAG: hypothetical protein D6679_02740 [Candidatus Hydrogenedentota bacterium]
MADDTVSVVLIDEERAKGAITLEDGKRYPWTAVRNKRGGWIIVLHNSFPKRGTTLPRLIKKKILRRLCGARLAA